MTSKKFVTSWSGGKDSCYASMQALRLGMKPTALLNVLNENGRISRSHAIPKGVLEKQSEVMGVPLITVAASWQDYERLFIQTLQNVKDTYQIEAAVFGDIDLQEHRDWEEKVCNRVGIEAVLPLWKQSREELVAAMIASGMEAYIVSCNEVMGPAFLGRLLDTSLVKELITLGVDACGENGEYHTLVVNAPIFKKRIRVAFGVKRVHERYCFIDMELQP